MSDVAPQAGSVPANTVFEQPWWLEAVAPGRWGEVLVRDGDSVIGRLPYVADRRLGVTVLTQPPLTRYLGPWVAPVSGKQVHRQSVEKEVVTELIGGLPVFASFHTSFAPEAPNWLPFYWAGFEATMHYTSRLDLAEDLDEVWGGLLKDVRKKIRRAERVLRVHVEPDLGPLLDIQRRIFGRQGLPVPFDDAFARRLDEACALRGARTVISAVDEDGRVHAAAYAVHDATTTYFLYGGPDPELTTSGAYPLVIWEAIRRSSAAGRRFDFLGSMMEPIDRLNRSFGTRPTPYLLVSREHPGLRVARVARDAVRRQRARHHTSRLGASTEDGVG